MFGSNQSTNVLIILRSDCEFWDVLGSNMLFSEYQSQCL